MTGKRSGCTFLPPNLKLSGLWLALRGLVDLSPHYESHVERRETILPVLINSDHPLLPLEVWASFLGRMRLATVTIAKGAQSQTRARGLLDFAAKSNLPRFQVF